MRDTPARDRIRSDLDTTLFVEAGAGSGKTTALVGRIVALVSSGRATIQQIAAITFTEAAAAELRIRVRESLEAAAGDSSAPEEERRRCAEALEHLDEAPISTIHGYCQRILAAYPIEAGLPPRFEVLDEVTEAAEWRARWSAELDRMAESPEIAELVGAARSLGVTLMALEELARAADDDWHLSPEAGVEAAAVDAALRRATVVAAAGRDRVVALLEAACGERDRCVEEGDGLLERLDLIAPYAAELRLAETRAELLPVLLATRPSLKVGAAGRLSAWGGDADSVRALVTDAAEARDETIAELAELLLRPLVAYLDAAARRAADDRRRRGRLTFHDLLVHARSLLASDASVRAAVRARHRRLLIDEFQDTDTLQLDVSRLVGAAEVGGPLDEGRCYFVGDPKQSIYRFRGADLPAYEAARARLAPDGAVLLTSNFRSVPGVLGFVNACFDELLGSRFEALDAVRSAAGPGAGAQAGAGAGADGGEPEPVDAGRLFDLPSDGSPEVPSGRAVGTRRPSEQGQLFGLPPDAGPPVALVGGRLDEVATLRVDQRRVESEDLCRVIELATGPSGWLVWDEADGPSASDGWRPARLGDVAVLVPRRTGLDEIERALDRHGIGYRVESASLIFRSQEVRDLLSFARAIADPGDHAALVGALRSPFFSIGDDDLVRYVLAGGRWSIEGRERRERAAGQGGGSEGGEVEEEAAEPDEMAMAPGEAAAEPLADVVTGALTELRRLRADLPRLGPVGVLSRAVAERRLLQVAAARPRARESWRRTRFLLDRLRAFVDGGGGGLSDFADWVDEQVRDGLRSAESVVPEADEDVVRIMTVHGAKGLEFPVTILCGFGTSDSSFARRRILRGPDGVAEAYCGSRLKTAGYEDLRTEELRLDEEEAARLLYVAATRARDHLVVCGHHGGRRSTLGERLVEQATAVPGLWRELPSIITLDEADRIRALQHDVHAVDSWAGAPSGGSAAPTRPALLDMSAAEYEEWCAARAEKVQAASRPANVRATEVPVLAGLGLLDHERASDADVGVDDDGSGGDTGSAGISAFGAAGADAGAPGGRRRRGGKGGTQVGRAVHASLQSLRLADAVAIGHAERPGRAGTSPAGSEMASARARLRSIAEAQARAERVTDRADDVERLVVAALRAPSVSAAFASGTARRELYVATTIGDVVLDGFVDLAYEADGGLVVVDYKTDQVANADEVRQASERYELQAAAYAVALGEVADRPVVRCVLVFLRPPSEPIEWAVDGERLTALTDRVRQLVGGSSLEALLAPELVAAGAGG